MLKTRNQIRFILLGLLVIACASVLVTYFRTKDHDLDHFQLSLVVRQQELSRTIRWSALYDPRSAELEESIASFEANMRLLRVGGPAPDGIGESANLPAETDQRVLDQLDHVSVAWVSLRDQAREIATLTATTQPSEEARRRLFGDTGRLLDRLDQLGAEYVQHMEVDLAALKRSQNALLLSVIPLLLWAVWIVRHRILRPADLFSAAFGRGDLAGVIQTLPQEAVYADEASDLLRSFEQLRPQMEAATENFEQEILRQSRQLMGAFEASHALVGQLELNPLLGLATRTAESLLQANSAAVCLVDNDGSSLELVSVHGEIAPRIGFDDDPRTGVVPWRIGSVQDDSAGGPCQNCAFFQACGRDNCLSAPLAVGGDVLGSICVVREPDRPFDGGEVQALRLLGRAAAVAISNARLTTDTRFRVQQEAVQAERERLAAELHDSLGQTLSYLNLRVDRARALVAAAEDETVLAEMQEIKSATSVAYGQVRDALGTLKAVERPDQGETLHDLTTFISQFSRATGLTVSSDLDRDALGALPPLQQQQALHIVREALTNVHRHAQASQVKVGVARQEGGVIFSVEDDGIGFNPDEIDEKDHLGVSIMRARARRCQAELDVVSNPGGGSRIVARFPTARREQLHEPV